MSIDFSLQNIASYSRVNFTPRVPAFSPPPPAPTVDNREELFAARRQLVDLFRALEAVAESMNVSPKRFKLDLPDARSNPGLSLNLFESAAFLASAEEINASPNSFSPFGPSWGLGSSALLTIGGAYDGSNGTGALSFEARRGGIKGINNLQIRVRDPQGSILGNYNIQQNDPPDQQYDLSNGLYFTLGAGALIDTDSASIDVFQGIGSAVDPDKPLAGVRNDNPNFQYYAAPDTLPDIVDGSFDINGETITVATTDTINSVIEKVNQSDAGVTAVFNPSTERIEFTQATPGSLPTVQIENDTSNFTTATKLDAATVVPGTDSESDLAFQNVADFSAVQSGQILINGEAISVDASVDSLETVIERVNSSAAGVTASFDAATQVVTIESNGAATTLELDSNGTNLFAALNIPEGRVDPQAVKGGISKRRSYLVADAVEALAVQMNAVFNNQTFSDRGDSVRGARGSLRAAINQVLSEDSRNGESLFGVRFDRSDDALTRGRLVEVDRRQFTRNLQLRGDTVKNAYVGRDENEGLIGRLLQATLQSLTGINSQLGISGSVIDTLA